MLALYYLLKSAYSLFQRNVGLKLVKHKKGKLYLRKLKRRLVNIVTVQDTSEYIKKKDLLVNKVLCGDIVIMKIKKGSTFIALI